MGPRSDDNARFGAYLKTLRDQTGVSRVEAAEQMGLSAEHLRLIERGARAPAFGQARRMADAYDGLLVPDIDGYTTDFLPSIPTSDDVGYDMKFTFRGLDTDLRFRHLQVPYPRGTQAGGRRHERRGHHRLGSSQPASGTELEDRQRQVARISSRWWLRRRGPWKRSSSCSPPTCFPATHEAASEPANMAATPQLVNTGGSSWRRQALPSHQRQRLPPVWDPAERTGGNEPTLSDFDLGELRARAATGDHDAVGELVESAARRCDVC